MDPHLIKSMVTNGVSSGLVVVQGLAWSEFVQSVVDQWLGTDSSNLSLFVRAVVVSAGSLLILRCTTRSETTPTRPT